MSNDMNIVVLMGRLTRDPELKSTPSGSYLCSFTLASNRTIYQKDGENKDEVGFYNCIAWGKLAEVISKYTTKGQQVLINGSLRFSKWDNAEGKTQSKVEIYVEKFNFTGKKPEGNHSDDNSPGGFGTPSSEAEAGHSFSEPFNDDIPF